MDKNSIAYWYPKVKDLVPTPRTEIIPIEWKYGDENQETIILEEKYLKEIEEKAKEFNFPLFIRGSNGSGKHEWRDTCYVEKFEDLRKHITNVIYWATACDVFGGIPCDCIALREFIDMDTRFIAFYRDTPINPERRYFVKDGKVICHHPYWIEEAIERGTRKIWDKLPKNWKEILKEINTETEDEIKLLTFYAEKIAKEFEGYWSIDFCRAKDGTWRFIDMATGERSWHQEGCPNKLSKLEEGE